MITRRFGRAILALATLALLGGVGQARADVFAPPNGISPQAFSVTITADENGNGTLTNTIPATFPLVSAVGPDTGPGGRPNALRYDMLNPPGLVAGDVFVTDASGAVSDLIRFNPTGSPVPGNNGEFVFYSLPGGTDLADLAGFPLANYANTATTLEVGSAISYTPTAGQPGFVAGAAGPVTYNLTSAPAAVPEPASLALFGLGTLGLAAWRWRRRRTA